jgi:hypothetical protein
MTMERSEEFIEQLKLRYRSEALKAIQDAEKRGYNSGYEIGLLENDQKCDKLKEQVEMWKAIASALGYQESELIRDSNADINLEANNKLLVKYVMNQIYLDLKKEYSSKDFDSLESVEVIVKNMKVSCQQVLIKPF